MRKTEIPWKEEREREIQVARGEIPRTERQMSGLVERKVKAKSLEKWKRGIENKQSLRWYKKDKPGPEKWYDGSWGSQLLFKARSNSLEIGERLNRWRGENARCSKCEGGGEERVESLEHIVRECPWYNEERRELERRIIERIGAQEWNNIKEEEEDMEFVLGFLEGRGEVEEEMKTFLKRMWKKRKEEGRYVREEIRDHAYGHV